ncbi:MAG: hypothetical protein DCF25_01770 [Leptolyngbya foveolarum]|uniref:Uncharacterized protein n=1 Tax=Leptolyngbya foveolarum TaxID=47253 RepID=A0A2W4UN97_9CYAN|nr:MAG: hypothetical protein DCF25_01770 [Leptolyngbya foveolarum]
MSENPSLPPSSDSPLVDSTDNTNSAQETSQSDANRLIDSGPNDWEVAAIPGTVSNVQPSANSEAVLSEPPASGREGELLVLLHDLNQCNDVLLSRVMQLEWALEKSQTALENEVANAQAIAREMAQQVSVEQAAAQQISYNTQQQIAKLVSKLDNNEQALSRQLLINENLQTEVSNCQERISQLERECTIGAQQHLEEVQARAKAESASKDLRSRLQRQQRYTMQFKAALEKSLTVTARSSEAAIAQPIAFKDATTGVMPKAQRIMPWVSDNSSPFAGIDPHLESLIRGVSKSGAEAEEVGALVQRESAVERVTNTEADSKLWQDIERVMNHTERGSDADVMKQTTDIASDYRLDDLMDDTPVIIREQSAEIAALEVPAQSDSKEANIVSVTQKNASEEDDLIRQIESSFTAANRYAPEEIVGFTEPSPWGKPLPEKQSEKQLNKELNKELERLANNAKAQQVSRSAEDSYLPTVGSEVDPAVEPSMQPVRSQTQPGSLSNIKLPTFRNAKVASFRR